VKPSSGDIKGFTFSALAAGIKAEGSDRLDFGLVVADTPAPAACVTTTNLVCAAPVLITRDRLEQGICQAVLANSGNANAYTGQRGLQDALALTESTAGKLGIDRDLIIPMSTGVIGNPLPVERMQSRIPDLVDGLTVGTAMDFARSIMTTDTVPKKVVLDGELSMGPMRMLGIAKGAGMIAPHMATMLAVILADVRAEPTFVKQTLAQAANVSFNRITVDGDGSTNDTVLLMAGGASDCLRLSDASSDREDFAQMLTQVCVDLARALLLDAEGATKLVEIHVCGARDEDAAEKVARTVAESQLVKTAFNGGDPNWGRIIAAAGRSGVPFDPAAIDLSIGEVPIVRKGTMVEGDWESRAAEVMKLREFSVLLDLKAGRADAVILTTDLSAEYVRINADYRS
jgi:glutamate N-acetyltransferase/amino-acid N-acetyltransferase